MTTETLYYVLRAGSTHEEQWGWSDIEALLRSGELAPGDRIFLPDENRWALLSETRLASARPSGGRAAEAADDAGDDTRAGLEESYRAALERAGSAVEENPVDALLEAGALADELGHRDESREHFQRILLRHPYHPRAAQEIKRRFPGPEQRAFRYLERPAPVWDDLGGVAAMPLARGPVYYFVPAAVFAGLSLFPHGGLAIAALAFLWAFQTMEYTARGATRPPEWNRSFKDPVRKLVRPFLLMLGVLAEWAVVIGGAAIAAMRAGSGEGKSLWGYMTDSPVFVVVAALAAVLYLPAATVSIGGFEKSGARTLDPRRLVGMVIRMEHEYVYTVVLVGALAALVAIACALTSALPVVGEVILGLALAYAVPLAGLMLGRLLGRTGHVIS